jgi:methionyl-tRNA formyltransferase
MRLVNRNKIKIIFFGTPEFAAGILRSLIEKTFEIAAVFAQPDKKIGRRREIAFSPVKKIALEGGIEVFQPGNFQDKNIIKKITNINPDLIVVAAYGKILPKEILKIPKFGAINVHASLLPKYRGASPVQCAILGGEKETGITLMRMNEKMDEGDILLQKKIAIFENETADKLLEKLEKLGAKMLASFVPGWISGKIKPVPQNHRQATYCKPIRREDGKIDWNSTAEEIFRKWRAYHPWPGIYSFYKAKKGPQRIKLSEIAIASDAKTGGMPGKIIKYNQNVALETKKGMVVLKKVQIEGKKEMEIDEFVRGYPQFVGSKLT